MGEDIKPDRVLDCIGLYCPVPIFHTTQEMEKLKPGQVEAKIRIENDERADISLHLTE